MERNEPLFLLPRVVTALAALLVIIHVARQFLSAEVDAWLVYAAAFIPARFGELGDELPGGHAARWTSWITHMLIHADSVHLTFNTLWLLVFGKAVADRIGAARCLLFAVLTGMAGALAFYLWDPALEAPVVGASGAISGLMGGTMRFMFSALQNGGFRRIREAPETIPVMTLAETLSDSRVQAMTLMLLVLNGFASIGLGVAQGEHSVAWQAHLGGYAVGLFTFDFFAPPKRTDRVKQPNSD